MAYSRPINHCDFFATSRNGVRPDPVLNTVVGRMLKRLNVLNIIMVLRSPVFQICISVPLETVNLFCRSRI